MRLTKSNENNCLYVQMYFLVFFRMVTIDPKIIIFQALLPPPEGGGELIFADEIQDPIQECLHRLLGNPVAGRTVILLCPGALHYAPYSFS